MFSWCVLLSSVGSGGNVRKWIIPQWNTEPTSTSIFPDRRLISSFYHPVFLGGSFIANISSLIFTALYRERKVPFCSRVCRYSHGYSWLPACRHMAEWGWQQWTPLGFYTDYMGLYSLWRHYTQPCALLALEQHQEAQVGWTHEPVAWHTWEPLAKRDLCTTVWHHSKPGASSHLRDRAGSWTLSLGASSAPKGIQGLHSPQTKCLCSCHFCATSDRAVV